MAEKKKNATKVQVLPYGHQFTVCRCEKCGEGYEADRKHVCRKENSYPFREFADEKGMEVR